MLLFCQLTTNVAAMLFTEAKAAEEARIKAEQEALALREKEAAGRLNEGYRFNVDGFWSFCRLTDADSHL